MDELHSLLKRQLKHYFGPQYTIPSEWQDFISSVNTAYNEFDSDRGMLERSLEISSQELIQANAETRSIIQLFPDAFLWLDQDGTILNYKSSGQNGVNVLQGIFEVRRIQDMLPGTAKEVLLQAISRSTQTNLVSNVQFSINKQDQAKYYEARVIPPLSNRILVIFRDVTEQIKAEESVRESERRFRELADLLPVVAFETDLQGKLTFINNLAFEVSGFTREELLGISISEFIAPEDRERSNINTLRLLFGGYQGNEEYAIVKKDGGCISAIIRAAIIKNSGGELIGFRGIMVDISERKRIEKELKESEEKYRGLVENIKLGIFRTSPGSTGRFLEVNQAMEGITGYSRDELLNLNVVNLYAIPEERNEFIDKLISTPEKATLMSHWVKKNGTHIAVSIIAKAIKDEAGRVTHLDGTIEDITERKKMEERIIDLYETEKRQKETLQEEAKARGMFIDVLAHELRTPLTPILASSGMLKDLVEPRDDDILKKLSNNIYFSSQTLVSRLEDLLDIARYSRGTFKLKIQPIEIDTYIKEVISRFKPSLDQRMQRLIEDIPESRLEAEIDASRLEQVIINLLSNASKFSQDRGTIFFRASIDNQAFQIDVKDNGIGIPQESQKRIFEAYHRVEQDRQQFPGLGLGLAVSKQIVEAHGGKIWLISQSGEGSTFSFRIPLKK
jgi:PAS domain S-box-containing protein